MQQLLQHMVMMKIVVIFLWLAKGRADYIGNSWVLNSRGCFHIHWNRDWFDTCKTCDEGFATLANNVECKIVGIGIVKIKILMEELG